MTKGVVIIAVFLAMPLLLGGDGEAADATVPSARAIPEVVCAVSCSENDYYVEIAMVDYRIALCEAGHRVHGQYKLFGSENASGVFRGGKTEPRPDLLNWRENHYAARVDARFPAKWCSVK